MISQKLLQSIKVIMVTLIIGLLFTQNFVQAMESSPTHNKNITAQSSFPSIKEVYKDNFYVGKMKDRDLWMVMERIDKQNIELWQKYAAVQSNPRAVDWGAGLMPSFTGDGRSF
jgi:hypothetical protein